MLLRFILTNTVDAGHVFLGANHIPPATVPRQGKCLNGDAWSINSVSDLRMYIEDLECIFQAGIGLTQVPLGAMEGTLLLAANSPVPGFLSTPFYQGDYSYKTSCKVDGNMEDFVFGQLRIAGRKVGVSQNTISKYPQPLAPGENPFDGHLGDALVMDFTTNTRDVCPYHVGGLFDNVKELTFDPFKFSLPPVSGYVDTGVIVGQDSDTGKIIMLNKAMAWDEQNDSFSTFLFYAVQIEDDRVIPPGADLSYLQSRNDSEWKRPLIPPVSSVVNSVSTTVSHFVKPFLIYQ